MLLLLFLPLLALSAHPQCRYACDDPVCPAVCRHVCEEPKCQIQCPPTQLSSEMSRGRIGFMSAM